MFPTMVRRARGWPEHDVVRSADKARYLEIGDALTAEFPNDRHFAAYSCPEIGRRLSYGNGRPPALLFDAIAAAGATIRMGLFVVDVDAGEHKRTPEWDRGERPKIRALGKAHPVPFVYTTSGGYRIVYTLPEPITIQNQHDAERWKARYVVWLEYLRDQFSIAGDFSCKEWQRLYRLPRVVRDGAATCPEVAGNPNDLGIWNVPADVSKVAAPRPHVDVPPPTFAGAVDLDECRRVLAAYARKHRVDRRGVLIRCVLAGKALALKPGDPVDGRHSVVYLVAQILGWLLPEAGPDAIELLVRPTLEAMDSAGTLAPKGLAHYIEKLRTDYVSGVVAYEQEQERQRAVWISVAEEAAVWAKELYAKRSS